MVMVCMGCLLGYEACPASDRCYLKLGPFGEAGAWEWSVCYTGGLRALRAVELKGEGVV